MIVRELLTRLGYAVNETQLNRYQAATNNIRQQADGAAEAFRNMFLAFAGFGAIKSIAKVADDMQSLEARIGQLPQTVTSAADAFDVVAQRASDARGSIDAYTNFYIKLQHAGKDFISTQEEGLKITDTITKALVLGGATAAEQSSTLLQFGQAIGSGVLQGDEFRALTEAAPQLVDALSKQLGIARGDLKKYASEGKLTSKEVIKAVGAIANEFDEKFKQMPLTIGTATTIIGNRWGVFINKLNRESSAVTTIANFFLKGFDSIESGLKSMVEFFGGATNTLKAFGIALAAALAPLAVKLFAGALATLVSPIGLLVIALALVGVAIDDFYGWLNGSDSVIGGFIGKFNQFKGAEEKINALKKAFFDFFTTGLIGKFIAALVRLKDYLLSVIPFNEILKNIVKMFDGIVSIFSGIFDVIVGLFKVFLGFLTGDFELWFEGIKQIFSGLSDIFSGLWTFVKATVSQSLVATKLAFKIAFDAIKSIIVDSIYGGIVWAAKKGWEFIKSLFGFGVSANVNTSGVTSVTPSVAAGAASAANGVPVAQRAPVSVVVNQTLPPGTPAETASAAQSAVTQAFNSIPQDRLARQFGQIQ